jgi:hypothetical protein
MQDDSQKDGGINVDNRTSAPPAKEAVIQLVLSPFAPYHVFPALRRDPYQQPTWRFPKGTVAENVRTQVLMEHGSRLSPGQRERELPIFHLGLDT